MKAMFLNPKWEKAKYEIVFVTKDKKLIMPLLYSPRYDTEEDARNRTNPILPFIEKAP